MTQRPDDWTRPVFPEVGRLTPSAWFGPAPRLAVPFFPGAARPEWWPGDDRATGTTGHPAPRSMVRTGETRGPTQGLMSFPSCLTLAAISRGAGPKPGPARPGPARPGTTGHNVSRRLLCHVTWGKVGATLELLNDSSKSLAQALSTAPRAQVGGSLCPGSPCLAPTEPLGFGRIPPPGRAGGAHAPPARLLRNTAIAGASWQLQAETASGR